MRSTDSLTPLVAAATCTLVALAVFGCATTGEDASDVAPVSAPAPLELTAKGKNYLELLFRYECAPEYHVDPDADAIAPELRTAQDWAAREAALSTCAEEKVIVPYTSIDAVKSMTWNGSRHTMSDAEMRAIAELGPAYLQDYVDQLVDDERARAGEARTLADQ